MEISGAVVIVTGASTGLGAATARLFGQHGAKVALAARSLDKLQHLAADLPDAIAVPVDLRDPEAIRQLVTEVHGRYGRVDAVINNAGQGMHGFLEQVEVAQYRLLMDLNLYGPLFMMQTVIPFMRQQGGGLILNVSAPLGQMPVLPSLGAYGSTKAALTVMTLTARAELAANQIRVCAFYPGMMATEMNAHLLPASTVQPVAVAWEAGDTLPPDAPQPETPEVVAGSLLDAFQREEAEYRTEGFVKLATWVRRMATPQPHP
ncbi:MAG TPA: SDR family oxidoreductase [Ktedonobacterales bacterium]|nr:SDR family oxidoreductase [Ktedonobacterales bacterium]